MGDKLTLKNILTIGCIVSTIITSAVIICTLITTYQFKNLGQLFNSYYSMQLGASITMALWALRFLLYYRGKERYLYSIISFGISIGLLIFMKML